MTHALISIAFLFKAQELLQFSLTFNDLSLVLLEALQDLVYVGARLAALLGHAKGDWAEHRLREVHV